MADKLKITDNVLTDSLAAVGRGRQDLENATVNADHIADEVGYARLEHELRSFASNWRIARGRLTSSMSALEANLRRIDENFTAADQVDARGIPDRRPVTAPTDGATPGSTYTPGISGGHTSLTPVTAASPGAQYVPGGGAGMGAPADQVGPVGSTPTDPTSTTPSQPDPGNGHSHHHDQGTSPSSDDHHDPSHPHHAQGGPTRPGAGSGIAPPPGGSGDAGGSGGASGALGAAPASPEAPGRVPALDLDGSGGTTGLGAGLPQGDPGAQADKMSAVPFGAGPASDVGPGSLPSEEPQSAAHHVNPAAVAGGAAGIAAALGGGAYLTMRSPEDPDVDPVPDSERVKQARAALEELRRARGGSGDPS